MTKPTERVKQTGEIFTPPELVDELVNCLYKDDPTLFLDPSKTFFDSACGDGEFLRGVVRKIKQVRTLSKRSFSHVIKQQLLGIDIMWDNVCDAVYYLLRSFSSTEERPLLESSGFTDVTVMNSEDFSDNRTLDEINETFRGIRCYTDSLGTIEIRRRGNSKHYIEYRMDKKDKWFLVENIVRADSLTEWDIRRWRPIDVERDCDRANI